MRSTRVRPADVDGLRELATPHLLAMGRLASRLTSPAERDDVVHAALAVAARERRQHDERTSSTLAWLLSNVADRARRRRPRLRDGSFGLIDLPAAALELDRWADIDSTILTLPWEQRLATELFYVLGLDVADCAAIMRCGEASLATTLATARERLIDGVEEIELS